MSENPTLWERNHKVLYFNEKDLLMITTEDHEPENVVHLVWSWECGICFGKKLVPFSGWEIIKDEQKIKKYKEIFDRFFPNPSDFLDTIDPLWNHPTNISFTKEIESLSPIEFEIWNSEKAGN